NLQQVGGLHAALLADGQAHLERPALQPCALRESARVKASWRLSLAATAGEGMAVRFVEPIQPGLKLSQFCKVRRKLALVFDRDYPRPALRDLGPQQPETRGHHRPQL